MAWLSRTVCFTRVPSIHISTRKDERQPDVPISGRMENVLMMEPDSIQVAIVDHFATARAAVTICPGSGRTHDRATGWIPFRPVTMERPVMVLPQRLQHRRSSSERQK
jgi:hypothetical protein